MKSAVIIASLLILALCHISSLKISDGKLDFTEIAAKYGHKAEKYEVITEDGYILTMFRIRGKGTPHLLMHGLIDSSDTWLLRGNSSLGITMANLGYDVWLGNVRGNEYSRAHVHLDPDADSDFWDFTYDEHSYYDLPSFIDTILNETGARKVNAIGHSQGNTIFYALGARRPEYNEKVGVLIALAPICYLHHTPIPINQVIAAQSTIGRFVKSMGLYEQFARNFKRILLNICNQPVIGYTLCSNLLFIQNGYDSDQLEHDFLKKLIHYFPAGTSTKNLMHFGQVLNRKIFSLFDYETANLDVYNQLTPPVYDLTKVTMKIALLVGVNDFYSRIDDVALLRKQLPNVVQYTKIPYLQMNHIDWVWGKDMKNYLFPVIFDILRRYNNVK